jgi:glyoxylase-like metal-dependent hydrolase (beta-lactamase superfamily II)
MDNFEILLKEDNNIALARVLLQCDAPLRKYPLFGVWCYFINTPKTLAILDPGPLFNSLTQVTYRKFIKKTHNVEKVMECLKEHFPDRKDIQILLSHYHFDHSEAAPLLQKRILREFNIVAPIRIHEKDSGNKRFLLFFRSGLKDIFRKAGYEIWEMGDFINDNEIIGDGDFKIIHSPGHTSGNISIINEKQKISICGTEMQGLKDPVVKLVHENLTHEDKKSLPMTLKKLRSLDYKIYFSHPLLGYIGFKNSPD